MLKKILSRTTHHVLSILIPIAVAIYFSAGFWVMCVAIALSWYVCNTAEAYVIRRFIPKPPGWMEIILTSILHAISFLLFYTAFFMAHSPTLEWILELKVIGLSMFATTILGLLYWFAITIYIEAFNGYNALYRREVYRRNE